MGNILDGIKVIEVASFVAGPSAAVQLSDFDAEDAESAWAWARKA